MAPAIEPALKQQWGEFVKELVAIRDTDERLDRLIALVAGSVSTLAHEIDLRHPE